MLVRVAVAVFAAFGLAAGLVYAAGAVNAKELVLHKSDMPAAAKRISFGSQTGAIKIPRTVRGQAGYVAWRFKNGRSTETVGAAAGILKSTGDAHDVMRYAKKQFARMGVTSRISVPRYGDEQFAAGLFTGGISGGFVLVRSGKQLWELVVSGFPRFSKSRMLSELKKYAAKQRARAGG